MTKRTITLWYGWDEAESEKQLTKYPGSYSHSRLASETDLDSHDLAEYLDRDAENENYHELNGTHSWLAGKIREYGDDEVADKVMLELLKRGGLHRG